MALKISLKPNEKIVVNGAVIANGDRQAHLHFLNNARFLREKDILQEEKITRDEDYLYFFIQLIYIDPDEAPRYALQFDYVAEKLLEAHPDLEDQIKAIRDLVESGNIYKALKEVRKIFPPVSEDN